MFGTRAWSNGFRAAALGLGLVGALGGAAHAETVVTVAMTAGDIPDWAGQPDQGFEGSRFVGYSLYEGLLNWDLSSSDKEVTVKPGLATEWHIDPKDPKRWIFTLRQGVKFHDGCDWNADVAVWNFDRLTNQKSPAFSPVYFARARPRTNEIAGLEKISDDTIAITTKTVDSLFPYNLPYVLMVSKCAVEKAGNDYIEYAKAPSGTGPYKFDKVVPHERLEFVKNTGYWDKNRIPKHDRLVLLPMPEATTRAAALLSGQVNFIEAPSPDMIPALKDAGMNVMTNAYPHTWPYLMNLLNGPFADIKVREAANYAVDRDAMVEMLGGIATTSFGAYTPNQKAYGKPVEYKTDTAKATELLKEANCYPCAITVAISPSGSGQMQPLPMNELVKSQLEAAGFKVNFEVVDWNTMIDIYYKGAVAYPQYHAINFSSGVMDPLSLLKGTAKMYQTPNGSNWGGLNDPQINELASKVMETFDPDEQIKMLTSIHELMTKNAARLFIVSDLNPRALAPNLKGFIEAQSWFQDMTPITVE